MIRQWLLDSIYGLIFSIIVLTIHLLVNFLLPKEYNFSYWLNAYLPHLLIYLLLFLMLRKVAQSDPSKVGFIFLAASIVRLLVVAYILYVIKKADPQTFKISAFHITFVTITYIIYESIKGYHELLKPEK